MRSFIEHAGRRVGFLQSGNGNALVWLHAFPLSADMWGPQLAAVPQGWSYIAPDLAGFGESTVEGHLSVDAHAADVVALFDTLGVDRVVLGGLSMGGYIAFAVLRRAAHRVRALILADTRPEADSAEARESRVRLRRTVVEQGAGAIAEAMVPRLLGATSLDARPQVVSTVFRLITGLPFIQAPTLLVVGQEDALTPVGTHESMQRRIPRSALVVLPKAGHLSNLEQPDLFNDAVAAFLARLS